jgi:hypothetical protein
MRKPSSDQVVALVVDEDVQGLDGQGDPRLLAEGSGGAEGLDAVLVLPGAGEVLQLVTDRRDDLAAPEPLRRRQALLQGGDELLRAPRRHERAARVAGEARHLQAQLLPESPQAVEVAPPPAPELEGVQASSLHLGGALLEGHVREKRLNAGREARPPGGRRRVSTPGEGQWDSGTRG